MRSGLGLASGHGACHGDVGAGLGAELRAVGLDRHLLSCCSRLRQRNGVQVQGSQLGRNKHLAARLVVLV